MKQKKSVLLFNLILLTLSVQGQDNTHRMSHDAPASEYLAEGPGFWLHTGSAAIRQWTLWELCLEEPSTMGSIAKE
ncbi:hypothetical protein [Flagellimonas eckloniae]|uniref:Uncharacterized protein n=1 Tax=Flagellimonas eckloniae TaxID=346185 RepID=A0A0Q0XQI0_9FLAO|nr:hypothetical protein [Allomuricauda eckloniae]KQC31415.1 hypothetical protein AAY42_17165 [Allomuricauda eckloniae]